MENINSLSLPNWPYLTNEVPGLTGLFKVRPEDFVVEEIPQYDPCGQGDHTYFLVEKTGVTTLDLIRRLGRALGRREKDFGYAGLKDSQAITRQTVSLEHSDPEQIKGLDIPGVKILWVNRHSNKIKLGHLAGNKFWIKLRKVSAESQEIAERCLAVLSKRGVPNYFGPQRYGMRGDSWILGGAILREDPKAFLDQFCGHPGPYDREQVRKARELYDKGHYELSAQIWPGFFRDAKRACGLLASQPDNLLRAFNCVDRKLTKLFISAYQSYLFNQVMGQRVDTLDQVWLGDLAAKEDSGGVFRVEDQSVEQPRADRFEISPTGPIFGYRMTSAGGQEGQMEQEVLTGEKLTLEDFKKPKGHKLKGSRRPFRVRMTNLEIQRGTDDAGDFLSLRFDLPSGSYATAVLRELMKEHVSGPSLVPSGDD
ncbi:MAG: tRNA pseudouridine(13) synthase TruD [Phycisphaerae bacterium]